MLESLPIRHFARLLVTIGALLILCSFGAHFVSDALCVNDAGYNVFQCSSSSNRYFMAGGQISCISIHGCVGMSSLIGPNNPPVMSYEPVADCQASPLPLSFPLFRPPVIA